MFALKTPRKLRLEVAKINLRVNWQIRARKVRVIDVDGKQLGIMTPEEGIRIAEEKGLDLVEVAPHASPPVCRIMDYGKYMYEQKKRAREAKKHRRSAELKEIKLRYDTAEHDYNFKIRHAEEFLRSGKRVKVTIVFRGREIVHSELGRKMLERVISDLSGVANVEQPPKMDGRTMSTLLSPRQEILREGGRDAQDEDE